MHGEALVAEEGDALVVGAEDAVDAVLSLVAVSLEEVVGAFDEVLVGLFEVEVGVAVALVEVLVVEFAVLGRA